MREIIGNTTTTPTPQSDWEQPNSAKPDYIKNKPKVLTEEEVIDLIGEYGGDTQIPADWEQHDQNKADYIKNKPDLLTLGETENTAYRGDYGKIAYEHSQAGGGMHMPTIGEGDNGKFLRAINGVATWATVPNAEDNTF